MGIADNTIVVFSTDNGAEVFTWPDGGMTPFRGTKGTAYEGGFRVPAIIRWPGKVRSGQGRERPDLRARLVPDLRRRGRRSEHRRRTEGRQGTRRHELQGPSRRLQSDRPSHRQADHRSGTRSGISSKPISAGSASTNSSTASSTSRKAGRGQRFRSTCRSWSTSSRTRSSGRRSRICSRVRPAYMNDVHGARILALRLCAAEGRRAGADRDRVSADAEGRLVQPCRPSRSRLKLPSPRASRRTEARNTSGRLMRERPLVEPEMLS